MSYVVRDASGEYLSGKFEGQRTPAADEAKEFDSRDEAAAACTRATDRVLERDEDEDAEQSRRDAARFAQ